MTARVVQSAIASFKGREQMRTKQMSDIHVPAATLALLAMLLVFAAPARAALGDNYGAAPINDHPTAIQDAPAIPGDHAFWAGACDRSADPGIGVDLSTVGNGTGFGTRPSTVLVGIGKGDLQPRVSPPLQAQVPVPAPASPDHCLDWGVQTAYGHRVHQQGRIWQSFPYDTGQPHPSFVGTIGQSGPVGDFAPQWRLPAVTQAGSHPDGTSMLAWNRNEDGLGALPGSVDGSVDNIYVDLPPGFVGNPQAVPQCTNVQFREVPLGCPPQSQVGVLRLHLEGTCIGTSCSIPGSHDTTYPVYNLEPRKGKVAELGFAYAGDFAAIRLVAKARTNSDFGVTAFVGQIPAALVPISQQITLWGVPWAQENDIWRSKYPALTEAGETGCTAQPGAGGVTLEYIPPGGLPGVECRASYDPSWGAIRPFFSAQTECAPGNVTTTLRTDAFQHPGAFTADGFPDPSDSDWKTYTADSPPVTGCEKLAFDPVASFDPTSSSADSASGLDVDIDIPQNDDPPADVASNPSNADGAPAHWGSDAGLATAQLDKTVVTLPEGMSVNPSAATGLEACSDAQMGVTAVGSPYRFNNSEPACPDGSRIGTVEATTPLLGGSPNLTGEMILGSPKSTDPTSGQMFRLFLVLRNEERGLLAKVHGTSVADPSTGRLTATFDDNPRVPVENIKVRLVGGSRGLLAMPQGCGQKAIGSQFTPWTAAHGGGGPVRDLSDSFTVAGGCANGFAPSLRAEMDNPGARSNGTFSFRFSRPQGDQYLRGLTATLPKGLLASVRDVPLCSNAAASAGSCPAGSKIGIVDAKAGSGTPFVLERKGEVFLTEGYKGGPYGLAVKIRPIAGPFRGGMELSPIVVRQSIRVDRSSAQVSAVSDPLPLIHHGVPLRVREVTVIVNRSKFMLNPSDCEAKQVGAAFDSDKGKAASRSNAFQAAGCSRLAFRPSLALQLTGRKQTRTGKHPGIKAVVKQAGVSEAGIDRAEVRLPKTLALDVDNAQALCEYTDGTKPDLENHCPKGSIIGRARAVSPLLNRPLAGNVYFVKNFRISSTGNRIATLPMLVVALRGEIAVNLRGESNTTRDGRLVNTFTGVPDAPVSQFNLNIKGGSTGILAVTRTRRSKINLCATGRQVAETDMDGHNGRRHDFNVTMRKPCPRRAKKTACKTKRQKATKACKAKAKRTRAAMRRR